MHACASLSDSFLCMQCQQPRGQAPPPKPAFRPRWTPLTTKKLWPRPPQDVYYSSLLVTALAARNLTVVSVPMAEYAWYTVRPSRALRASAVFHRLTTWTQLNTSGLVAPGEASPMQAERLGPTGLLSQWWREQSKPPLSRCQTFARRFRVFRHERTRMRGRYSCGHWRVCEP